MSTDSALVLVLIGWVVIGVTLSVVMGRRGHDAWSWLMLGAILGPLAVVLAFDARRHAVGAGNASGSTTSDFRSS